MLCRSILCRIPQALRCHSQILTRQVATRLRTFATEPPADPTSAASQPSSTTAAALVLPALRSSGFASRTLVNDEPSADENSAASQLSSTATTAALVFPALRSSGFASRTCPPDAPLADTIPARIPVQPPPPPSTPTSSPSPCPPNLTFAAPAAPAVPAAPPRGKKLAFFVSRTPSLQLPVYHLTKRGGNKKLTCVKKVDGNTPAFVEGLRTGLGMKRGEVLINPVTGHVVLRGHRASDVRKYLLELGF